MTMCQTEVEMGWIHDIAHTGRVDVYAGVEVTNGQRRREATRWSTFKKEKTEPTYLDEDSAGPREVEPWQAI